MNNNILLSLDLVPATAFGSNVRAILTRAQWASLSKQVRSQAYDICQICQGEAHDCHERWSYDEGKSIQKLVGLIALCKSCHQVCHFGLARVQGKEKRAQQHLMKVNGWTNKQAEQHIQQSFKIWAKRSKKQWTLDISILSDYGIDVK